MPQTIATFPAQADTVQTVRLEGTTYRLRCTWRARLQAWYWELRDADDAALITGRRLSGGWGPLFGVVAAGAPRGAVYCWGPDTIEQGDLGTQLIVNYYPTDEIPAADTGALDVVITIP